MALNALRPFLQTSCKTCRILKGQSLSPRPLITLTAGYTKKAERTEKRYTPRRAMLYIPGSEREKLDKISTLDVDCAVMDCEDGVALNRKVVARETILSALDSVDFSRTECAVRVNAVHSGMMEEDLRFIFRARNTPQTLFLPKVEHPADLTVFSQKLQTALMGKELTQKINLLIFVETAIGVLNLRETCQRGVELSETSQFELDGVVFGSDDFCADIGATRSTDALEVLYARQRVLLTAKAFKLQAIDLVNIDYKDMDSLKIQAETGAHMGFTGKQVIHPAQIPIVQAAFTPSQERITWATELITAFDGHSKSGKGAFTFQGIMVDKPLLLQAKNVLRIAERVGSS